MRGGLVHRDGRLSLESEFESDQALRAEEGT